MILCPGLHEVGMKLRPMGNNVCVLSLMSATIIVVEESLHSLHSIDKSKLNISLQKFNIVYLSKDLENQVPTQYQNGSTTHSLQCILNDNFRTPNLKHCLGS